MKTRMKKIEGFLMKKNIYKVFIWLPPFRRIHFRRNPFWRIPFRRKTDSAKAYLANAVSAKNFKFLFHLIKLF
jgi:phage-related protein